MFGCISQGTPEDPGTGKCSKDVQEEPRNQMQSGFPHAVSECLSCVSVSLSLENWLSSFSLLCPGKQVVTTSLTLCPVVETPKKG